MYHKSCICQRHELIKKLCSHVLINSDKHNVVYGLLFHSSLILILKIIEIIAFSVTKDS